MLRDLLIRPSDKAAKRLGWAVLQGLVTVIDAQQVTGLYVVRVEMEHERAVVDLVRPLRCEAPPVARP